LALAGCSLLTIKSPEIPLTPREQEARLLTRDYAAHFITTVSQLIDDAAHGSNDAALRSQALRLKLAAVTEITRASTGLSPVASLLDTWAFSLQFRNFLVTGAGADLLGSGQSGVRLGATLLAAEADAMARKAGRPPSVGWARQAASRCPQAISALTNSVINNVMKIPTR
jgi:hypothetical protein